MKHKTPTFLAGVVATLAVIPLTLTVLAANGYSINVSPINVQVNGKTFAPTDVNGKEVPVFVYEGTTYAPLRALAEEYGLYVGYDETANMATVSQTPPPPPADYSDWTPEMEAEYEEFKALWDISVRNDSEYKKVSAYNLICKTDIDKDELLRLIEIAHDNGDGFILTRLANELRKQENDNMCFWFFTPGDIYEKTWSGTPSNFIANRSIFFNQI